jgi:hypothetical protein
VIRLAWMTVSDLHKRRASRDAWVSPRMAVTFAACRKLAQKLYILRIPGFEIVAGGVLATISRSC